MSSRGVWEFLVVFVFASVAYVLLFGTEDVPEMALGILAGGVAIAAVHLIRWKRRSKE